MKCPFCSEPETKVVDSRLNQLGEIIRRRRECLRCEGRFTTYERVEEFMPELQGPEAGNLDPESLSFAFVEPGAARAAIEPGAARAAIEPGAARGAGAAVAKE